MPGILFGPAASSASGVGQPQAPPPGRRRRAAAAADVRRGHGRR